MVRLLHFRNSGSFFKTKFKLLTTLLLILSASVSISQSLSIISYDSLVIGDAENSSAIYAYAAIKNNAAYDIDVKVKRIDGNYTALTDSNAICWGICHLPDESVSKISIPILAGGVDSLNFTGHVYPDKDGIPATGDITYVFFDENNPQDSVAMTVQYQVDVVASISGSPEENTILLYPNPVLNKLHISFIVPTKTPKEFNLYSLSGENIYTDHFRESNTTFLIDLSAIPRGVYVYSISDNEKVLKKGKLILN